MLNKIQQKLSELKAQKEQLIVNTHMVNGAIQLAELLFNELLEEEKQTISEADAIVESGKEMESKFKARPSILKGTTKKAKKTTTKKKK